MKQYLDAVREILEQGTRKENRTGVDTLSTFGVHYDIDMRLGFPLLTTKKVNWKNIVVENLWFLSGEPKIDLLQKHGCKFWDAWADEDGAVPSAYGNFWRRFPVHGLRRECDRTGILTQPQVDESFNDQIAWVVDELKRNPMSRRLVVSAWAPGNAQTSKLPPCHIQFVLNVQNLPEKCGECGGSGVIKHMAWGGRTPNIESETQCGKCMGSGANKDKTKPHLCLHLTQRSCDIALGVPYNIAGYAFLLELFARFSGIPAGIFAHTLVDAHAYTCKLDGSQAEYDHVPGLREQLTREPRALPRLSIGPDIQDIQDVERLLGIEDTDELLSHFELDGYDPAASVKLKVAV